MKRILAAVAALVLAAVGALAVLAYAGAADARAVAGQEAVTVYVTTRTVPAGTTLGDAVAQDLLEKDVFPSRSVPAGALTRIDVATEQLVAMSEIASGEIVLQRRFADQQAGDTALVVPEGQMAVTVELTDPGRVGSFLRPGSDVAIYDSYATRDPFEGDMSPVGTDLNNGNETGARGPVNATRVVVPRVEVLAVGDITLAGRAASAAPDGVLADNEKVPTALVTLAVSPADAARLIHAAQTGQLYAALLGSGADAGDPLVEDRNLFGGGR